MHKSLAGLAVWMLVAIAILPAGARAAEAISIPDPPCSGTGPQPAYPRVGAPPAVAAWSAADLEKAYWTPPACTFWTGNQSPGLLVALSGSFRARGGIDALLGRIGAVSSLRETLYWSVADQAWLPVARDAAALENADPRSRRPDFSPGELVGGAILYYSVHDARTGPAIYRLRILERDPSHLVLASENVSPVRFLAFTLFQPGTLETIEFVDRKDGDIWQVYLLARAGRSMATWDRLWDMKASAINRSVALYRRLADIPSDQEPPASP